ncbi:collagen alpha-1(I) chain-like isoform X1 [Pseudopipra pipra]|uniref:collagen alpha-1(I) chain-like isoform X1 n=1 Tax=Pseudopipra pipra TaxID=415032 RepID=UPI003138E914
MEGRSPGPTEARRLPRWAGAVRGGGAGARGEAEPPEGTAGRPGRGPPLPQGARGRCARNAVLCPPCRARTAGAWDGVAPRPPPPESRRAVPVGAALAAAEQRARGAQRSLGETAGAAGVCCGGRFLCVGPPGGSGAAGTSVSLAARGGDWGAPGPASRQTCPTLGEP